MRNQRPQRPLPLLLATLVSAWLSTPAHAVIGVYDRYFFTTEATTGGPGASG